MSNEIKNRQHVVGMFAPVPAAPFTTPIVSEVGVSSFVRNGAGNYSIALTDFGNTTPARTYQVMCSRPTGSRRGAGISPARRLPATISSGF